MTLIPAGCQECFLYGVHEEVYIERATSGYVARGENTVCVSRWLYMASSRVKGYGLRNYVLPSLVLVFNDVTQITISSFGAQSLTS